MTKNVSRYPQHVHNKLRLRELTVLRAEHISASFQHIVLGGNALDGFTSHGFNNHAKVFFPESGSSSVPPVVTNEGIVQADGVRPLSRDYTSLYGEVYHGLALGFYIHDGGVASTWAMNAREGDRLTIGGLRGSLVVPEGYTCQVYMCDEPGIPTLRRHLEPLSRLAVRPHVTALVSVQDVTYQDYFAHLSEFALQWFIDRDERAVNEHLSQLNVLADDCFIWITGEDKVVENLCARFETEAFDQQQVHTTAHWHQRR